MLYKRIRCLCDFCSFFSCFEKYMFSLQIKILFYEVLILFVESCYSGIKNGRVPDSAMTASSFWAAHNQAFYCRLDNTTVWHAAEGINKNLNLLISYNCRSTRTFN